MRSRLVRVGGIPVVEWIVKEREWRGERGLGLEFLG